MWSRCTRTEVPWCVAVHLKEVRHEPEGCPIPWSLKSILRKSTEEMVASKMEDIRARRFCHSTRKTGLERFFHSCVFHKNAVLECSVLKMQKMTAGGAVRWKVLSTGVTRYSAAQLEPIARLQSSIQCRERLQNRCVQKMAVVTVTMEEAAGTWERRRGSVW